MSSNTQTEAEELRAALGGREGVTARSGSDSPLRFSGAVLRRVAKRFPEIYVARPTASISSRPSSPECARGRRRGADRLGQRLGHEPHGLVARRWDRPADRRGRLGPAGRRRRPRLAAPALGPSAHRGRSRRRLLRRALRPLARVRDRRGIGRQPQSKVLASGALLSLGTSFVLMVEGERPHVSANAMYDGLGRPFLFGCRTNGALAWESVRKAHGLAASDFAASEAALASEAPGRDVRIVQTERESFPDSPAVATP